ncbi:MAG: DNA polymerase III subunit alpha [Alphaproteobacteria bacterium]|nr:DNA polymerase III subunit alpha [Alphaproteobacteria bacterium]
MGMDFVHLSTHTTYSLLQGLPSPKKLAAHIKQNGQPACAVTDSGNAFGAVDISKSFSGEGIQPIMGTQLTIWKDEQIPCGVVTLLAQNKQGWTNILRLISLSNLESPAEHRKAISLDQLLKHTEGVICLTGGARFGFLAPYLTKQHFDEAVSLTTQLKEAFGNRLYIELQRHELDIEQQTEPKFIELAERFEIPLVATNDCRFLTEGQEEAFDALVCIGESTTVDTTDRLSFNQHYATKSTEEMLELFADIPEATANTVAIAQRCGFYVEQIPVKEMFMPQWPVEEGMSVPDLLRKESEAGLAKRLEEHVFTPEMDDAEKEEKRQQYEARLKEELDIIINMGFDGYFIITSDFIKWAKEHDIPVGPGRGSGAGSLVAWSLLITDLDPLRWDLYFERFLNPDRVSLPDFDIDFCQDRRDEVIHYVQEKYGKEYVSQIITFGTLKARACIRDVGRVLQMSYGLVSRIAAFVPEVPNPPPIREVLDTDERLRAMVEEEEGVDKLLEIAMQLEGSLRHASTHAAGVIISDRPIADVCGLYNDSRSSMPATQLAMFDAEYSGLVKFDFLGLKTLTTIQQAIQITKKVTGDVVDIGQISLEDTKAYDMLCHGHTVGVFQIESAGMTDLTKRMQPQDMEAMSALVALYRPGPLGSGMVDDYIDVRHGKKEASYPHDILKPALLDTFGVPVYQEQIMRMARDLAGYTLGGADMLRRAMGKKKKEEMDKQRQLFVEGSAKEHSVPAEKADSIFDLMAVFAGYGFNKAHSMAYALISYQTAYLKAHYPLPFMAATMTLDKGNTDKLLRYKAELQRMDSDLLSPDVNASMLNFAVEDGKIRHALSAIKGAGEESMAQLIEEREQNGNYKTIWDLLERLTPQIMSKKNLEVLIKAGALDSLYPNRAELLANTEKLQAYCHNYWEEKNSNQIGLFGGGGEKTVLQIPNLVPTHKWDLFEQLQQELTVIGFYLSAHPLAAFRHELTKIDGLVPISTLEVRVDKGQKAARVAGVVLTSREMKTKKGDRMAFATISDESGQQEAVLFPKTYAMYAEILTEKGMPIAVTLAMEKEGERLRLSVESMAPLENFVGHRPQITLKVGDIEVLQPLQQHLMNGEPGATSCQIILSRPNTGDVTFTLPKRITCTKQLLAQIEVLDGVQLLQ